MPPRTRTRRTTQQKRAENAREKETRRMINEIILLRERRPYLREVKSRIGIIGNEWFVLRVRYGPAIYRAFEAIGEIPATILHYEEIYLHETEPRLSTSEIVTLARRRLRETGIIIN